MVKLPKNQVAVAALPTPDYAVGVNSAFTVRNVARKKIVPLQPQIDADPEDTQQKTTTSERLLNKAVAGLGKRASGFVTCEVKTTYEMEQDGSRTVKSEVVTRKQNPPDLDAIIFALTNLDGGNWRAKPASEPVGVMPSEETHADLSSIPDDVLRGLLPYFRANEK